MAMGGQSGPGGPEGSAGHSDGHGRAAAAGRGNNGEGSGAFGSNGFASNYNYLKKYQELMAQQGKLGTMGNVGSNIEKSWIPGVNQAGMIYNEGLPDLDPNGYLESTMADLAGPNPYVDELGAFNPNNPALSGLQNFDASNPAIAGFDQFMPGNTNPYADRMFDISAGKIKDQINSQFGASGLGSNPGNMLEQYDKMGDYAAKFYGGIYDADMNRALAATGGASDAYQARNALDLNARGMATDAYGRQDDQRINATTGAMTGSQSRLNSAASFLPGIQGQIQTNPWANLTQYADVVGQLTGTSPQQPRDPESDGFDKLMGVGMMAAAFMSDRRLKENIERVGTDEATGLGIYEFNYTGGSRRFEGVMADEVQKTHPNAVTIGGDGYARVYYDMLGLKMREVA